MAFGNLEAFVVSTLEYSQLQQLLLLLVTLICVMYRCTLWCVLAATFFCTYELTKSLLKSDSSSSMTAPFVFMIAATVGEVVSITVTYPTKLFSIKCTGNSSCEGAF